MTDDEFRERLADAERGSAVEQAALGLDLLYREGLRRDYALARRLLTMAYDQGVLAAAVGLGMLYLNGWGVDPDPQRGVALLNEAADRGHWPMLIELARLYRTGDHGVPLSPAQAAAYYRRAVDSAAEARWDDTDEVEEAEAYLANGEYV